MNRRRSLTTKEKDAILRKQDGRCAMCGREFLLSHWAALIEIEFDHWVPVALGNESKPDSAMHKSCHARKTKRDIAGIAEAKRIERKRLGLTKPKRKMQSRGFDKRLRRKMDGTVEERT